MSYTGLSFLTPGGLTESNGEVSAAGYPISKVSGLTLSILLHEDPLKRLAGFYLRQPTRHHSKGLQPTEEPANSQHIMWSFPQAEELANILMYP